jgi:hypothetical protein
MKLLLLGCTVCYGDPASPLSKGAAMGVIVLGIAIAGVLGTFAGLFLFWMKRARALQRQLDAAQNGMPATAPSADPQMPLSPAPSTASPLTLH